MKKFLTFLPSFPWISVHEGEGAGDGAGGGGGTGGAGDGAGAAGGGGDGAGGDASKKTFTQDQVNAMLAEDRRKHKVQVEATVGELEKLKKAKGLSEKERSELQGRIEELNGSLLSKQELAQKEQEKLKGEHKRQVETLASERDTWHNRYVKSTITRSITDEAVKVEAYNPSQIVALLSGNTRLVEELDGEGNPIPDRYVAKVHFSDSDKDGKPVTLDLTVAEALKRMRDREDFANLFKSNVTGGLGGAGSRTTGKQIDPKDMSHEQWMAHRKGMGLGRKTK